MRGVARSRVTMSAEHKRVEKCSAGMVLILYVGGRLTTTTTTAATIARTTSITTKTTTTATKRSLRESSVYMRTYIYI